LNLTTVPPFTLPDEAGRTVYVPADPIVPATGALSSTASRAHPEFGQVLQIGSDLQSDTKQLTLSFTGATSRGAALRVSYTLMRARDQSSFSCCAPLRVRVAHHGGRPGRAGMGHEQFRAASRVCGHRLLSGHPGARNHGRRPSRVRRAVHTARRLGHQRRRCAQRPRLPLRSRDRRRHRRGERDARTPRRRAVRGPYLPGAPARPYRRAQLLHRSWQPAFDLQVNWRPSWLGLDRRLTLSLLTVNLLGGLDQWLHGAANLHGWGYGAWPDPVLLYVNGFDPTTNRFRYTVNGRFGSIASTSGGISVPFQLGLQGRYALGPGRVRQRARAAAPTPAVEAPTLPANLVAAILQLRDSLGCTTDQVTRLGAISDSLDARDRILADSMQAIVQQSGDRTDPAIVLARLGPLVAAARENVRQALARARTVLTRSSGASFPSRSSETEVSPHRVGPLG